jgi:signal transduction histidine kinase
MMRHVIRPFTQNTPSLGAFIDYLHAVREDERVALARRIHDELGGHLVSAAMDLGWVEAHAPGTDLSARLRRLGSNLAGAIDMKRHMIEQLRPTLLDNFGLFEALRWYFKHACHHAKASCKDTYPDDEVALAPATLSNVFRASQTLLDCTFHERDLKSVDLEALVENQTLTIRLAHEHLGIESIDVLCAFPHELGSAAHRVAACQGELSFESDVRGLVFPLSVPLTGATGQLTL